MSDWDLLSGIATRECPSCGAEVGRLDASCSACGAALPVAEEEAETPLSVFVGGGSSSAGGTTARERKVPVEKARNLIKLRQARDGLLDRSLEVEDYVAAIEEVAHVAWMAVELFKTQAVKGKVAGLPPEQAELVRRTEAEMRSFHAAVKKMRDPFQAEAGYAEAEASMWRLDALQDEAIERGETEYPEE